MNWKEYAIGVTICVFVILLAIGYLWDAERTARIEAERTIESYQNFQDVATRLFYHDFFCTCKVAEADGDSVQYVIFAKNLSRRPVSFWTDEDCNIHFGTKDSL